MNEIAVSGTAVDPFHRNRAIIFSLFALVLAVFSFHGVLDNLASTKIAELTKESLGLLLVSRGINAAVSILQTIEFKIPFVSSAQIGQILDPVNDGAERLSAALIWATGSLFLQNILLKITSGAIFKWGFFAISAMTVTFLLLAQSNRIRTAFATSLGVSHVALAQFQGLLIKIFIVATIVRFIVPAFAIASLLTSEALVAPEIKQHTEELERQEKSLSKLGTQISEARDEVIKEQTTEDETPTHDGTNYTVPDTTIEETSSASVQSEFRPEALQVLREQRPELERTLTSLESERETLTHRISERQNAGWTNWIRKFAGDSNEALAEASARIEQLESAIDHKESEVACIDQNTAGEPCESYLAEHRNEALGDLKLQLKSEQKDLRERLQSLEEERERHIDATSGEAEGGTRWRDKVVGALPKLLGDDSAEEVEAVKRGIEDIDHDIAETSTLAKQQESVVACVNRRITGEHCDSAAIDDSVRSALDSMREQLASDLRGLRADLTLGREERTRLSELEALKAERRQVDRKIEKSKDLIDRNESDLECAERFVAGKDCDTISENLRQWASEKGTAATAIVSKATLAAGKGLSTAGQAAGRMVSSVTESTTRAFSKMSLGVLDGFKAIVDDANDMVTRMAQILVLIVIENVVLPIIFLAIALKGSVPVARGLMRVSTTMSEDAREALAAMDKALPSPKG